MIFFSGMFFPLMNAQTLITPEDRKAMQEEAELRTQEFKEAIEKERVLNHQRLWYSPYQKGQSSELSFSKSFDDESINSEKTFIINRSARSVSITLSGAVENGTIKLSLYRPDGEEYQVLDIDNSSDIRWRQSFSLDEDEDSELYGKWRIKIKAQDATGNYSFRMITD